jgi:hypothetical protein
MSNSWKHDRAKEQIDLRIKEVDKVEIVDYTRDMLLESIPRNRAYRMDAVHLYADILNLTDLLETTDVEGETCHKRALRFLNLHYRAVSRILSRCDARQVDFHNQRLHAAIAKPYGEDEESARVNRAVAIAQLIIDVLAETGDDDDKIPNALVRVGIDTGRALVVNNGRNGARDSTRGAKALIVRAGDYFGPRAGNNWFSQGLVKAGHPVTAITYPGRPGIGHQWAYLPDVAETMVRLVEDADLDAFATFHTGGHWDHDGRQMIEAIKRHRRRR